MPLGVRRESLTQPHDPRAPQSRPTVRRMPLRSLGHVPDTQVEAPETRRRGWEMLRTSHTYLTIGGSLWIRPRSTLRQVSPRHSLAPSAGTRRR